MKPTRDNPKNTPEPQVETKPLVWFIDGPLGGANIGVTKDTPIVIFQSIPAGSEVTYCIEWTKPTPMAFCEDFFEGEAFQ